MEIDFQSKLPFRDNKGRNVDSHYEKSQAIFPINLLGIRVNNLMNKT